MIAVARGLRVGLPGFEQAPRDAERQRDVAAGSRLHVQLREIRAAVAHRVDHHDPRPVRSRLLEDRQQMHAADVRVLPPDQDRLRVQEVEQIVAVLLAEIGQLGDVPRAGADVAGLHRARAEQLEEPVVQVLHDPQRAAAPVVEDRRTSRFGLDAQHRLRDPVERVVPRDRVEPSVPSHERRGDRDRGRTDARGNGSSGSRGSLG